MRWVGQRMTAAFTVNGQQVSREEFARFLVPFLFLHGFLFLGGGYLFSRQDPGFALMHSGIGILVYMVFFVATFPDKIGDAVKGALASIALGLVFGDYLLDHFYAGMPAAELTWLHRAYAVMVVFYLYTYLYFAREFAWASSNGKRQKQGNSGFNGLPGGRILYWFSVM